MRTKSLPAKIRNFDECQELLAMALDLMEKPESALSDDDARLLKSLGEKIDEYENRIFAPTQVAA